MKWINHKILTGVTVYAITNDIGFFLVSAFESIFSDFTEGKEPIENGYRKYSQQYSLPKGHRKHSHWFIPYAAGCLCALFYTKSFFAGIPGSPELFTLLLQRKIPIFSILSLFCLFFFLGYIFEDAICGYVPPFDPEKKEFGIRFFYPGSLTKYTVTFSYVIIILKLITPLKGTLRGG